MNGSEKRIFITLFFAIFNAILGVGIVIPLLPVYAKNLGASGLYISMIFGAFSLSRTFLLPYFGKLSDKRGRKPLITAGLLGYTIVSIAFVYFSSVEALITIRFFQGIASAMIMPATQAYVGDITPKGKEGLYMGAFNMSMFLSLSLGPLMGGFISEYFSLQVTFFFMGVLSTLALLISLIFLPPVNKEISVKYRSNEPPRWTILLSNKNIAGLFIYRVVYTIAIAVIWCFIPVYADEQFGLSSSAIGVLVTSGVFISGILNTPMGYIADRYDKKKMIIAGGMIVCISLFSLILADGFWSMLISISFFGVGGGLSMPPLMALAVMHGAKEKALGSVMAILTLAQSLGMLSGSVLAGLAMDYLELKYSFPLAALIMAVGLVLCMTYLKNPGNGIIER